MDQEKKWKVLGCPNQSPDLYPIEMLWGDLNTCQKPLKYCIAEEILQGETRINSFQPSLRLFLAKGQTASDGRAKVSLLFPQKEKAYFVE